MDLSASAATKDAARIWRRRSCTPPRFSSTLPDKMTSFSGMCRTRNSRSIWAWAVDRRLEAKATAPNTHTAPRSAQDHDHFEKPVMPGSSWMPALFMYIPSVVYAPTK